MGLPQLGVRAQLPGDFGGVDEALRSQDHQQPVAVGILRRDFDRPWIAVGVRVADDVDGIVVAPVLGKKGVERLHGLGRQFGYFAAVGNQRVGGEHAGAACVGDHHEPRTPRQGLLREQFRHVEDVRDVVDAEDAGAPKNRVEDLVGACEHARVRQRGPRRGVAAPRLDHNDRLAARHFLRRRQERPRVVERLHVDDDRIGLDRPGRSGRSGRPSPRRASTRPRT